MKVSILEKIALLTTEDHNGHFLDFIDCLMLGRKHKDGFAF